MKTAVKYLIFASMASVVNLFMQFVSFKFYDGPFSLYVAILCGTFWGLVTKFILDKKFIFYYETNTKKETSKKFLLYSFTGIFTTLIFWSIEIVFDYVFKGDSSKYVGAIIGLSTGYTVKYQLDKAFVFKGGKT